MKPWTQTPIPAATKEPARSNAPRNRNSGILGDLDRNREEFEEFCREREQREKIAAELDRRIAAYQRELEESYGAIRASIGKYMRDACEVESRQPPITEQVKSDWKRFEDFCAENRFPSFPAAPEAVAAFLSSERDAGLKRIEQMRDAILLKHSLLKEGNPCADLLVRAVVRSVREEEEKKNPEPPKAKARKQRKEK